MPWQGGIDDVGLGVLFGLENYTTMSLWDCSCTQSIWRPFTAWDRTPSVFPASSKAEDINPDDFDNGIS